MYQIGQVPPVIRLRYHHLPPLHQLQAPIGVPMKALCRPPEKANTVRRQQIPFNLNSPKATQMSFLGPRKIVRLQKGTLDLAIRRRNAKIRKRRQITKGNALQKQMMKTTTAQTRNAKDVDETATATTCRPQSRLDLTCVADFCVLSLRILSLESGELRGLRKGGHGPMGMVRYRMFFNSFLSSSGCR